MSISSLMSSSSLSTLFGSSTSTSDVSGLSSVVAQALATADQRLQTDQSSTTTQLSSFGLLKSAVAQNQGSAQAMMNLTSSSSTSDVTTAMGNFFNDYNSAITAAGNAAATPGSAAGVMGAQGVSRDMQWALNSQPDVIDAMKTVGLTLQSDGTLQQNASTFSAAESSNPAGVQQAMATIGNAINTVATQELGSTGAVGSTIANLTQHNTTVTAEQQAMTNLETQLGITSPTATAATSAATGTSGTTTTTGSTTGTAASASTGAITSGGLTAAELSALVMPSTSTNSSTGFLGYGLSAYQSNTSGL